MTAKSRRTAAPDFGSAAWSARISVTAILALTIVCGTACSEFEKKKSDDRRSMTVSTGQYNRGYRDGLREAQQSFFNDHAGWMWLWMKDKEYANGYERGWADGRRTVDLGKQQKEVDSRTDSETP